MDSMTIKLKSGREIPLTVEEYFEVYFEVYDFIVKYKPFTETRGVENESTQTNKMAKNKREILL